MKKRKTRTQHGDNELRFIALLLLLFCCFTIRAEQIVIGGSVSDLAGIPIELVTVQVKGTASGTFTNEKGKYSLSVTQNHSATLVFSCLGYSTAEVAIENTLMDTSVNVRLHPQTYELKTAVITAKHIQTNTMANIDKGQGRLSVDATGGSVETLIMTAGTGVSSTNELSTQYSVRGGNYNENIIYVNGIEIYRPLLVRSGQQEGLSFINPDMTDAVRFSSGGFDACYGDRMSSVLDITYKKPEKLAGGITGSMLGGSAYMENATGNFTQITGWRYKRGTTLLNTLDTKGDYNPSATDLQTFMTYSFSPKLHVSFLGNFSQNTYDFNPDTRTTKYGTINEHREFTIYYDGMEKDCFKSLFGNIALQYHPTENTDIALQVSNFESHEEETYDISGEYWISNVSKDDIGTGLFLQHARNHLNAKVLNTSIAGKTKINQNTLCWSVGIQKEQIKDYINEWELRDSAGFSLPTDTTLKVFYNLHATNDMESMRGAGYIQETDKFRTKAGLLVLTAGIRGSYWNYNKEIIFSPRVSLGFIPTKNQHFTFRIAAGIYYQSPFYKEFRFVKTDQQGNNTIVLNKDIVSQHSVHWVVGEDYNFQVDSRPYKLTAEIYYKKLNSLIPYTIDNMRIQYYGKNALQGYITGIDTKLFGQFVSGTDSWIGISLMEAKQYINGEKVCMPTDQLYNFTFYFTDYLPKSDKKLQANLRMIWAKGLPFGIAENRQSNLNEYKPLFYAPPYRRADIGITYLLWGENTHHRNSTILNSFKNVWAGLDIFNLFDIRNVSSYSWFTDVSGTKNAVPNRLTGRQFNIKLIAEL